VQERLLFSHKIPTNAPTPSFTESTSTPPTDSGACKFTKEPYLSAKEPYKCTNACICSISQYITHRFGCVKFRKTILRMRKTVMIIHKRALFVRKRALQTLLRPQWQHLPAHHPETGNSQKSPMYPPKSLEYPKKSPDQPYSYTKRHCFVDKQTYNRIYTIVGSICQYVTHRLGFNYTSALSTRKRALIIRKRALIIHKRALQTHLRRHRQHLPIHHPQTRVRGISQKNPTYAQNSHDYVQKSPTNAPAPSSAASANTSPKDSSSRNFAKEPYSSPKKP